MDNVTLLEKMPTLSLGFAGAFLKRDWELFSTKNNKDILSRAQACKNVTKMLVVRPVSLEQLRFVLEKVPNAIVLGMEQLAQKDSAHYPKGGLDQVLCAIAAQEGKIIAFSFHDILHAVNRPVLLARMMANIHMCQKYKVKMFFGSFAESAWELRSAEDLFAFWQVLGGKSKNDLRLS